MDKLNYLELQQLVADWKNKGNNLGNLANSIGVSKQVLSSAYNYHRAQRILEKAVEAIDKGVV